MSNSLKIERWAFWSPETRVPAEWRAHWIQPAARPQETRPSGDGVPAAHRRRMSALSKMALQVGFEVSANHAPDFLVFCSQHGELVRTRELLGNIVSGIELSPAAFSQSVHNTSAGLYTIISHTVAPASSLAAGANTFAYGWLEAEAYLYENPRASVLLVSYDDLLPVEYRPYSEREQCCYALAVVLRTVERDGITLEPAAPEAVEALPMAPLFMEWCLSAEKSMYICADGQGWVWSRSHGA